MAKQEQAVAVLDFGKTRAKLSLFSIEGECLLRLDGPAHPLRETDPWRLDLAGLERWAWSALASAARQAEIVAIVPVGHGAAAVLLDGDVPIVALDYEAHMPADADAAYEVLRDPFESTLSPRLPAGLNLGRQLFWLERLYPDLWPGRGAVLLWPQYWAWRLSGERASEVTSLGCHSDLWRPAARTYSHLAIERGWAGRIGGLRHAAEILGQVREPLSGALGLPRRCQVHVGLHDSNAALSAARRLSALSGRPFGLVSTGTWFVVMASGGAGPAAYDQGSGMLANVDVEGRPVPTARFMGGRDYEAMMGEGLGASADPARLGEAAALNAPESASPPLRATWAALELARRTSDALDSVAAEGPVLIEGRFAADNAFAAALAQLRPGGAVHESPLVDGVAEGAYALVKQAIRRR